jgi:hypothetical protein
MLIASFGDILMIQTRSFQLQEESSTKNPHLQQVQPQRQQQPPKHPRKGMTIPKKKMKKRNHLVQLLY